MGLYDEWTYRRTPCQIDGLKYFYLFDGKKYYSERLTTWDEFHLGSHFIDVDHAPIQQNGWCYVNPGDPMSAVLYVDSYRQWSGAQTRVLPFTMLFAGAIALTVVSKRKKRRA